MLESSIKGHSGQTEIDSLHALTKAKLLCKAALDEKASNVLIMDMRAVSSVADYFVICSASSSRRVQAIAGAIAELPAKEGVRCGHIEGKSEALWVLVDYGDVIAHVFQDKIREFYNLERLWHDAPKELFSA